MERRVGLRQFEYSGSFGVLAVVFAFHLFSDEAVWRATLHPLLPYSSDPTRQKLQGTTTTTKKVGVSSLLYFVFVWFVVGIYYGAAFMTSPSLQSMIETCDEGENNKQEMGLKKVNLSVCCNYLSSY